MFLRRSPYFVFAYVGLTVPVIAVGFGARAFGDFRATLAVAIALAAIALAAIALASMATIRRSAASPPRHPPGTIRPLDPFLSK